MSYPPGQKPPQWSIDSGIVAYNASRFGLPMPVGLWAMWEKGGNKVYALSGMEKAGAFNNSPTWKPDGVHFNGSTQYINVPTTPKTRPAHITVSVWIKSEATSYSYAIIAGLQNNLHPFWQAPYLTWTINRYSTNANLRYRISYAAAQATYVDGTLSAFDGTWHMVTLTYDGETLYGYVDAKLDATQTAPSGDLYYNPNFPDITFGMRGVNWSNEYYGGIISQVVMFNCALVPSQIADLYTNPYSLIADPYQIETLGYVAAGVGAYTLTASGGSYSLSGTAASLLKDSKISAGIGSYSLLGTAANLLKGYKLATVSGSYALSGTVALLLKDSKINAGVGVYTYTGQTAALLKDSKILAESGAYILTGSNVSLIYSGAIEKSKIKNLILLGVGR